MKKLLFLAATWPEPASSAAGTRSLQVLSLFPKEEWQITIMCAAEKRPHSAEISQEITSLPLLLNDSAMDEVFRDLNPNVVIFDRFMIEEQYGWRIEKSCPHAIRILDSIDLHSLRDIRRRALHENRERAPSDWFCDLALRELASIYRCDLSLIISDAEVQILTEELALPPSILHVLPFLLHESECRLPSTLPGFHQRKDFSCIGNFRHPPNADSIRYLHDTLWPQLRQRCPGASIKIYGADLTPAIQSLDDPKKGFHICGRADNALQVMREARVCLAPLRYGAGLKGKLLDAMLAGTPSVTTPIGAEGMQGSFPWPGAVEADPEAWINAASSLYENETEWHSAQQRIEPLLRGRFDRKSHSEKFLQRIDNFESYTKDSSVDQLTGAILRHHHHRSTEYMSRWIEAKNAKNI